MPNIIFPGYVTEGLTDNRFLESIIQRSFSEIAYQCQTEIEVYPIQKILKKPGEFVTNITQCAIEAEEKGIMILCVHTDADDNNDSNAFNFKINPAFNSVQQYLAEICKNLVAVVPIHMTEAWMLADKNLLINEIHTNHNEIELGIHNRPESYNDPKYIIEQAIRIARLNQPQRRRNDLTISDLYSPIGQKIDLISLNRLPSFQKFFEGLRQAFITLNYQ